MHTFKLRTGSADLPAESRHWTYLSRHRLWQSRPCASACQKRPKPREIRTAPVIFLFIDFYLPSEKPLNRVSVTNTNHGFRRLARPSTLFRIPPRSCSYTSSKLTRINGKMGSEPSSDTVNNRSGKSDKRGIDLISDVPPFGRLCLYPTQCRREKRP